MGLDFDVMTGSAVVDMYAKCKCLCDSLQFFSEMPEKNWVTWSAAIAGCVQNDEHVEGLQMFVSMQREGLAVSQSAYASVLRSCAALVSAKVGRQIHGHALKNCFGSDVVVGTAILDMYAKSGSLDDALRVFQALPNHTLQSWNAIFVGCVRNNQGLKALELFQAMNKFGIGVDEISLSGIFSACAETRGYLQGSQAHCLAIKTCLHSDICVSNAILDMYGKCGALTEARIVFEEMNRRDAVSWNAIIAALEQNEQCEETLLCFAEMLRCDMEPDEFTYGSVLKACASLESLDFGIKVHDKIIKCGLGFDSFVGSTLVDMYCKCGAMEEAMKLHNRMEMQTMISWNAITSGFSLQNQSEEAQKFFSKMLNLGLKPDNFTYATILDACANLVTIELGRQIHVQIIKDELQSDVFISSSLVDMYAKCGNMQDSRLMFEKMAVRDHVSWNALICGYSQHGFGAEAICIFERMQQENVKPNHATFLAVLRACGHAGLVDVGERYFDMMTGHYKLQPQLEHYSCMVDLIGRTKGVHEALEVINKMPFEADDIIWRTLLSACKIQGDVEVAEIAARNILSLDPEDSSAYVLLSNIYAEAGRWTDVSKLRKTMRRSRLKKEPGCSWIELKNKTHAFLVGDKAHPRSEEIYERLDELIEEMKWIGYDLDINPIWTSNG
ncbi:putative tetratricopeptide-like helical domain superfamily, DYW domain-containing protein [Dioscorea sansibarensis]